MSYTHTKIWTVDKNKKTLPSDPSIVEAADYIKRGEVVAFPTETVYGLGADASSREAVNKIFAAKGRPGDNPLIVHIADYPHLDNLNVQVDDVERRLMEAFWPGPLTIVLHGIFPVSANVTAGLDTLAVRMPDHPVALALIKASGKALAAPSANLSGRPSPTKASHVTFDLDRRIAGVVDGGETGYGLESTVVEWKDGVCWILRPGGVTKEQIEKLLPDTPVRNEAGSSQEAPKSPGTKYRHYAPDTPLFLIEESRIMNEVRRARKQGKKTGVLSSSESYKDLAEEADFCLDMGSVHTPEVFSSRLYSALREADEHRLDVLFCPVFEETEMGAALMNRLKKAAEEPAAE
ncbi:L-threonylcarbamoyladenylate synthase [Sinobaca qinghaiensis]|uniref:Threonylcarbamoyl-AMP synthase n=1 Tax=Sinobaca qinghaiensis TaxID=342944 RepID=A0A419V830_9BACL|nr:L-threonylcarbamoyladenylate synthase [Sinobaca qinghaiensis]RKD76079.1 L-threonylcarbamoyladenylate synthase [Sinobaca qinghaiensis]